MARKKGGPDTISGYFRGVFTKRPELLEYGATNAAIIEQWKKDHAGEVPGKSVMGNLANIKSIMRKELGLVKKGKGRKKRKKAAANGEGAAAAPARAARRAPVSLLERMESLIDECLSVARGQGSGALE